MCPPRVPSHRYFGGHTARVFTAWPPKTRPIRSAERIPRHMWGPTLSPSPRFRQNDSVSCSSNNIALKSTLNRRKSRFVSLHSVLTHAFQQRRNPDDLRIFSIIIIIVTNIVVLIIIIIINNTLVVENFAFQCHDYGSTAYYIRFIFIRVSSRRAVVRFLNVFTHASSMRACYY